MADAHLKREINSERNPGEEGLAAFLRTAPKPRWQDVLAKESILIQYVLRAQRTMRLAKLIPTWDNFVTECPEGWRALKRSGLDVTDVRKLRAWWDLLLEVQRKPDDRMAVTLALFYVAQELTGVRKEPPLDKYKIDLAYALQVKDAVARHFKDLHPVEITPGADLRELTRPKYEPQ